MKFKTENSWNNLTYSWWAKREDKTGKPRWSLIPIPELKRVAELYTRGAEIYGDYNWAKGDLAYAEKAKDSLMRHMYQYLEWDEIEDHMAAVVWNLFTIEALKRINEEKICQSEPAEFADEEC